MNTRGSRKPETRNLKRLVFLASGLWLLVSGAAHAASCLTLYGSCKYPADFQHFDYVNPNAPRGGTVKLAETGTFDDLNPFILKGVKAPGLDGLFDSLMVQSQDEPLSMYPLIAESVSLSPDRSHEDFTLNPAARWHDGTPITPDDVVFSFTTLKTKGDPSYSIMYAPIASCKKTGPHSVRFTFSDTKNRQLPLLAAQMPILSRTYYATHDFTASTLVQPLSSGPYEVASVDPGRSIVYKRVKNYWGRNLPVNAGQNNFGAIRYDMYRDENVTLQAFLAGDYDFRREYIARNWATAYDSPAVRDGRIVKREIPDHTPQGMQAFIFNTRKPYLSDRRVRQAIDMALDYEWINKTIFYNAYVRNQSFFENTDFQETGLPKGKELALLRPFRCTHTSPLMGEVAERSEPPPQGGREYCLPPALFTEPFKNPVSDGSGDDRTNLLKAQALLDGAGWHVGKDGWRQNAAGQPLSIEFLLRQPTMERVIGPMRQNLKRLGIHSSIRMVDDSQYQKRTDSYDFDIISAWIDRGLFYPGGEQVALWQSLQADVKGGNNLGGVKNPAVDALLKALTSAKTENDLIAAGRALDRVLLWEHYVIPNWHSGVFRVAYQDKFGIPKIVPKYGLGFQAWWVKPDDR
ncbi:MAG: ABC transporter substrate-binding protein [Pseudomonadota bacterium]|nr:ABC transporter substrate-binding protein [Pseudomonadota bacterium]MDE3036865.1 ABC transporter substrate-binding protein [Pseudomonadota bacterium]